MTRTTRTRISRNKMSNNLIKLIENNGTIALRADGFRILYKDIQPVGGPLIITLPKYRDELSTLTPNEVMTNAPKESNAYWLGKRICLEGNLALEMPKNSDNIIKKKEMDICYCFHPVQYYKLTFEE